MPDFLLTVFMSKNLCNFNLFKIIQDFIKNIYYFMLLVTCRQYLGPFSALVSLWKIMLYTSPCERCIAGFAEGRLWSLALGNLLALARTVNCLGRKEKNNPWILKLAFLQVTVWREVSHLSGLGFISLSNCAVGLVQVCSCLLLWNPFGLKKCLHCSKPKYPRKLKAHLSSKIFAYESFFSSTVHG